MFDVTFGQDDAVVVSASLDKTLRVFDAATGANRIVFKGHSAAVRAVAVAATTVFSGDDSGEIVVWDLRDGRVVDRIDAFKRARTDAPPKLEVPRSDEWPSMTNESALHSLAASADGNVLALSQGDGNVRVWDVSRRSTLKSLHSGTQRVHVIRVSPDGRVALTASHDGAVRLWDIATETIIAAFTADHQILSCAISPDAQTVIAGEGTTGRVHFLRVAASV